MTPRATVLLLCGALLCLGACSLGPGDILPASLPPVPEVPAPEPVGSVPLGDPDSFGEEKLDLPLTEGPFQADWASIEENYPGTPQWLRDAKFGIWVHFGPQASGQSGDWYARNLYLQGHPAYANHLARFGHPSKAGYKDVLREWNPVKLDPAYLASLYRKAGARFLMVQGVHHDNFDLWDSRYQPWNSVNIGPGRDLLREWADACRAEGLRYGVTFHHEYTWWWWQSAFGSDASGDEAGVPYDGNLTLEDGKGTWWEGYDPRLLYGVDLREYKSVAEGASLKFSVPDPGIFTRHLAYARWYATQWALRIMDVTAHYDPDFIYTDGNGQGPFTGAKTGTGYKCNALPAVMADYYNRRLRTHGSVDAFSVVKFRKPTNGTVTTAEFNYPRTIDTTQTWIRETPVGDWFYAPGFVYDPASMIRSIIESVSRDGNVCINICLLPDGSIEPEAVAMLEQVGRWMDVNGSAVYGSRAWKTIGEGGEVDGRLKTLPGGKLGLKQSEFRFDPQDIRFTRGGDGAVYAFCMEVPRAGQTVGIRSLGGESGTEVAGVSLLGYDGPVVWSQSPPALSVVFPEDAQGLSTSVVFRIETR